MLNVLEIIEVGYREAVKQMLHEFEVQTLVHQAFESENSLTARSG